MAKILKAGRIPPPPPPKVYRGTCGNCNTVAEFEEGEVDSWYPGFTGNPKLRAGCPLCKKIVTVEQVVATAKLTWRDKLPWRRGKTGKSGLPIPVGAKE